MAANPFKGPSEASTRRQEVAWPEKPLPRREGLLICIGIWVFALLLRVVYLWQIRDAPMFSLLMGDARSYDSWAQEIAKGNWLGHQVFYQAPLYPYFLGLLYTILGHNLFLVRVVQVILGATSCLFIALAGRFFFSRSIGILAGLLLAVYPSAIYFDCLIQKSALDLFLLSLLLFTLGIVSAEPRAGWWIISGVILGCLTLSRENALVLVFVIALWLFIRFRRETLASRMKWACSLVLGLVVILFPVALRNQVVGGEFHLTTSQFGPNFYIGNNKGADGTYKPLRPDRGDPEFERQDATELAETALGRKLSPAEVSRYWTGQALSQIRSDPSGWLRLMARKWFLVWNALEIPDTEDQYTYSDSSFLLKWLTLVFHLGILCPLGVLGIVVTWRMWDRIWVLYMMLVSYAASVAVFYVFARYRFPIVAWLVLFAAAGLVQGYNLLRAKQLTAILTGAGLTVVVGVLVNQRPYTENDCRGITQCNIAQHLAEQPDKIEEAIAHYRLALRFRPYFARAHHGLGLALSVQGKLDEAVPHYLEALRLGTDSAATYYDLATALTRQGKLDEAIAYYAKALRLEPDFAEAHYNLGNVFIGRGQLEQAAAHYRDVLRISPGYSEAHNNLGFVLANQGRFEEAISHYLEALRLNPTNTEAHFNLAIALMTQGKPAEAIAHYTEALRLRPDDATVLNDLARILATHQDERIRNRAEAMRLAARACELTGNRDPAKLDTLAVAYAAGGRFQDAIQTGQKAADLAVAGGDQKLARAIRDRLELYKAGKPYRE
jgi:tetratricopeptide (TPR) repeat protein